MTVEERITVLSAQRYEIVGRDHHKDRDCHFYIEKAWSYGEPPIYVVQHWGYVAEEFERKFPTSSEAHNWLCVKLREMILEEGEEPRA